MSAHKLIIVGQGISGTFLSWFCQQAGIDYLVIDAAKDNSPSRVAAGIINPVTGRRVVKVWLDELLLPFAEKTYTEMGAFLNIRAITKTRLLNFFPNPFIKESFLKKLAQQEAYIDLLKDDGQYATYFHYEFGAGIIDPAYIAHLDVLLPAWRQFLQKENRLVEASLDFSLLKVSDETIRYGNITAAQLIFCDGTSGAKNPYFSLLPFALNKGEALMIEAPELPPNHLYKKSLLLAPLATPGLFWAGTNYLWDFENILPTPAFRQETEQVLRKWLKIPFKIVDHKAAIRPATIERRPFAGFHPVYKNIGILNGMGTKGCSLAPYFAQQFVAHIQNGTPLLPEVDIRRFSGILRR